MSSWAIDLSFWAITQNLRVIDLRCNKSSYENLNFLATKRKIEIVIDIPMQNNHYLSLPNKHRKLEKIDYSDILYLQSIRNYTLIHLQDGTVKMSTKTMLFHINHCLNDNFIRIHRTFCVNKYHIQNFDKKENVDSLFLKGGIQLAISRRKRSDILRNKAFDVE